MQGPYNLRTAKAPINFNQMLTFFLLHSPVKILFMCNNSKYNKARCMHFKRHEKKAKTLFFMKLTGGRHTKVARDFNHGTIILFATMTFRSKRR